MENKVNNFKHQATGWDHFRAKKMSAGKKDTEHNKKPNKLFSWIMKTINPINHIPVIGTIKNLNSKAEKSLDIVQSALGGIIYGGPYGFLKGIGSWIVGKVVGKKEVLTKIIPQERQEKVKESNSFNKTSLDLDNNKLNNTSFENRVLKINSQEKKTIVPLIDLSINRNVQLIKDMNAYSSKKAMRFYANKNNVVNEKNIDISA